MKNTRKQIIINKPFQFKLCFIVSSLVFVSTLIYPVVIYDIFDRVIDVLGAKGSDFEEMRSTLFTYLAMVQIAFTVLMIMIILLVSHKIAGPMFKLTRYLRELREGKDVGKLYFRDGDYFPEIAEEINKTVEFYNQKKDS